MAKYIDIVNQRFGNLIAKEPTRKNNRFAWLCKCDCGNEIVVDSGNLRAGRTQSCGCIRNKKISSKVKKDLTGKKFDKLTILEECGKNSSGNYLWKCQCDCGNIILTTSGNLLSGHTKSCGCLRKSNGQTLDIIGNTYGKLTVLEQLPTINQESHWLCSCECGNQIDAVGWHLTTGLKSSCGCLKSKGEQKIASLLQQHHIPFEQEKTFEDCLSPSGYKLRFDFYINNQYLIEYDGIQHFISYNRGWSNDEQLAQTQLYDAIKDEWCKQHNISLIRIPYTQLETLTIEDLLIKE